MRASKTRRPAGHEHRNLRRGGGVTTDTPAVRAAKELLLPRWEAGEYLHDSLVRSLADDRESNGWSLVEDACQHLQAEFMSTLTTLQRERYEQLLRAESVRRDYADGYTILEVLDTLFRDDRGRGASPRTVCRRSGRTKGTGESDAP